MFKKNYTTLYWLALLMAIISIYNGLILTGLVAWATVIGTAFGIIVALVALIRWGFRKRLLSNPIKITYLIPDSKHYEGAPEYEIKPKKLTIGIGEYQIFILHTQRITLTQAYPPVVELRGSLENKPKILPLKSHPFVVGKDTDAQGNLRDVDWHGNLIAPPQSTGIQYLRSAVGFIAQPIQTYGNWEGLITVTFRVVETDKPIMVKLPLIMSDIEQDDQIPFLKKKEQINGNT